MTFTDNVPSTTSGFKAGNFSCDEPRRIKVVHIGAGFAGICAGIRLLQRVPNIDLTIYDCNGGIGGSIDIRDSLVMSLLTASESLPFMIFLQPEWSAFCAPGPEILEYLKSAVKKWKLMPYIKLSHKLIRSEWNEQTGKWQLTLEQTKSMALAKYRRTGNFPRQACAQWKELGGTGEGGPSPTWKWKDTIKSWKAKNVAVIGVIVPTLQPKVAHLTNFVRGKTWIAADKYTDEDKKKFNDNPKVYSDYQREIEKEINSVYPLTIRGTSWTWPGDSRKDLGMCSDSLPNWFNLLGTNAATATGSLLIIMEHQVDYVVKAVSKLQRERLKSMETVLVGKCQSWYKMGKEDGRVAALWPGSPLHALKTLANPRWEDFDYEPLDEGVKNRFCWLGDGTTIADEIPGSDNAWYLDPEVIDIPPGEFGFVSARVGEKNVENFAVLGQASEKAAEKATVPGQRSDSN
ncbi:hypothetical protein D9758_009660 [Tetrapyrgos nigripes]|uniref:Uncharacterized protein n=1 Tax=Tetrapyrgos nigripes TaxID=182062 RepID=A0A8H5CQC5_9AGAR|nr:hypothetical protein D9758_009660 [Tetrapyrgos nigripes]